MKYAPIAIFAYNRLDVLKKTLKSLKKNSIFFKSKVLIFIDGPKNIKDKRDIDKVKEYLFKNIETKNSKFIMNKKNVGLRINITRGLDFVFKTHDKCIILEDDILVSKEFLKVMNYYLNYYKKNKKIASIEGYMYPVKFCKKVPNAFFLRGTGGWGWATWKRSWKNYTNDRTMLIKKVNQMKKEQKYNYNFNNSYNYLKILNTNENSWAINWYSINYLKKKYTLFFKDSLVKNIGFGSNSTHTKLNYDLNKNFKFSNEKLYIPKMISEDGNIKNEISKFLKLKFNFFNKINNIIKKILK